MLHWVEPHHLDIVLDLQKPEVQDLVSEGRQGMYMHEQVREGGGRRGEERGGRDEGKMEGVQRRRGIEEGEGEREGGRGTKEGGRVRGRKGGGRRKEGERERGREDRQVEKVR